MHSEATPLLSSLLAVLTAGLLASPAAAQDATQSPNGLTAPVVQVPTGSERAQPQAQPVGQQQTQPAPPPGPVGPPPQPVQQVQIPQQGWGYTYQTPVAYAPVQAPSAQYGYQLPAQEPQFHYEERERATRRLWVPGVILFGLGWVGNFAIATPLANAVSDERDPAREEDAWAWAVVPIIGPIAQLATEAPHPAIPVTMGLMQIGGLALFIAGMLTKETVQVRVVGPPRGQGTTVDLDAVPVQGGGVFRVTVGHL